MNASVNSREFLALSPSQRLRQHGFGSEHATLHRGVLPLILAKFSVPASQPISKPPGKTSSRQRLWAALGDGARAVGEALAAFEELADHRMLLVALEFLERAEECGLL
jgi:hypothetical protein